MNTWKASDAKRHFAEVMHSAASSPQVVLLRGKPASAWEHGLILATRNTTDFQGFGIPLLNLLTDNFHPIPIPDSTKLK